MTAARHLMDTTGDSRLITGRVVLSEGGRLSVALETGGETLARPAASCLLVPGPGDRVLVALAGAADGTESAFVLAVLERDGSRPAEVVFEGDAALKAAGGTLDLAGGEGVRVTSGDKLSLLSRVLDVKAGRGRVALQHLEAVASTVEAHCDKLGIIARSVDRFAERIAERAKRVYRFIDELDQLRAHQLDYRAEETAQVKGKNTVVTAREVVKMDGEQVHIG